MYEKDFKGGRPNLVHWLILYATGTDSILSVNCRKFHAIRTRSVISVEILVLLFWLPGAAVVGPEVGPGRKWYTGSVGGAEKAGTENAGP